MDNPWKHYRRKALSEMRPYVPGEDMSGINISPAHADMGHPRAGDMIARDPNNSADLWLVPQGFFDDNYEEVGAPSDREPGSANRGEGL